MITKIVDECPPEFVDKLSPDHIGRAIGFALFMRGGKTYCVPVTDKIKKGFGLKVRGGKYEHEHAIVEAMADITQAVYLQTRETVGEEIKDHLTYTLTNNIREVLYPQIDKKVDEEMKRQIEHEKENNEQN